jgi:hypothetical protein
MALVINDRVLETSTSTGTGAFTLAGAVQDYQTFATAIGGNNTTYYTIVRPNSGEFETGLGTLNAGGTVLTRTTVYRSSNSNNLVSFDVGSKLVFCDYLSSRAIFKNADGVMQVANPFSTAGTSFSAPNTVAVFYSNVNGYSDVNAQNTNSGISASTDFVATADNGTDTTNFIDMGINSSTFSDAAYTILGTNDGYLYTQGSATGGNLAIGTGYAARYIKFFQGGTLSANEVARFTPTTNNLLVGTTTDAGSKIRSNGVVESTSGGFKFPDGTTQITANQNWKVVRNGITVGVLAPTTTTPYYPVQSYNFTFTDAGASPASTINVVPSAATFVTLPDISTGTVAALTGLITFSAAHNLSTGNSITISGATSTTAGWNGTWTVTVVNTTQVNITFVTAPSNYISGATVTSTTTASGPVFGGDELEMDGITVAANCTTAGTVNLYISAINGAPLLGLRNFNYSIT